MRTPVRALACLAALTVAMAAGPPASAGPKNPAPSTVDAKAGRGAAWVTLITGDRIAVVGGRPRQVDLAKRSRPVQFAEYAVRGDWYVVPSDAQPLISAGVLDRQLFNVTGLVRQGYDDAHSKVVPMLAEYPDARTAAAPTGARKGRVLPSLGLTVLNEQKSEAPRFWSALTPGGPAKRAFSGGVRKLWLNGKVRANLDKSVPQVGAPTAWKAGYTGKGVTVAVLDTGYDTDHADFAGRVGATKNFTPTGTVDDKYGHGTHVASIALGSGAASKGKYKGVAPDAKLAVGKVLDDNGSGQFDWIIAGMEWAATGAKAKVVNMSLGGWPTDGTDPMSLAVNRISKQYGTLFVIAAGNFGRDGSIGTPAAADAALSIGSVTKADKLSEFSSRGPRLGDNAIKPDLAAPGSDIVAARATGTFPDEAVDENYARLSGTSMATPHVAGAAAILAQQHPDWTGDRLKAALMGTAKPLGTLGPNAVGAGRLDLVRATAQQVQATPGSLSTYLKWPHATAPVQRRTVTYYNAAATPVTLKLNVALTNEAGKPAPAGLATLSASTVTVPARGKASVTIAVKAVAGKVGNYAGVLGAATADGKTTVRTPVGVYEEPERYDLVVKVKDRTGADSAEGWHQLAVTNLDTGDVFEGASGEKVRIPPGRYTVIADVVTPRAGLEPTLTFMANPEIKITRNTTLTFDGRTGKRVSMAIDQPAAKGGLRVVSHSAQPKAVDFPYLFATVVDPRFNEVYAASTPGVRSSAYAFTNWLHAVEPDIDLNATGPQKFPVAASWLDLPTPDLNVSLGVVYGGAGTPADLAKVDAKGKLVALGLSYDLTWEDVVARLKNVKAAGGRVALAVPVEANGRLAGLLRAQAQRTAAGEEAPEELALPTLFGQSDTVLRFLEQSKKAGATASLVTKLNSKHRYEVAASAAGSIPPVLNYDRQTKDLAAVKARYFGHQGINTRRSTYAAATIGGQVINPFVSDSVPTATERTEYFSPGVWEQWSEGWDFFGDALYAPPAQLKAGPATTIEWNKAAYGTAFTGNANDELGQHPWAQRVGNLIDVTLPLYSDSAGHLRIPDGEYDTDTGTTSLHRDGKLVGSTNVPGRGVFPVPMGDSTYLLSATSKRAEPRWPLATSTTAQWQFKSNAWEGAGALPLLTVGFQPAVDLRNTVKGGQAFSFPATVTRQAGSGTANILGLRVNVSYDDGKTWKPATVVRDGAKWKVTVTHPASGYVSLRAFADDAEGNIVEQTVIRAYQLR